VWRRVFVANSEPMSKWCEAATENSKFSWTAKLSSTVVRRHFSVFFRQGGKSSRRYGIAWGRDMSLRLK
jgi:hypothetical protein